ncbi:glycerol-3-phosphate 1-O-acyltransferase PlsY [Dethiothermospora halolimnae]|uniref:glycerol-3-phosphate 1-O-acyltransferase PlsY n=1 Tax=Dethiothermospora halolimnae TaxID=3114390 RepID=UPI003CCC0954
MLDVLAVIVIGYFLGNFSSGYIMGKYLKNKDIRKYGSGNAGATNALRVFGGKIAALTFAFDVLKGVLAVIIGNMILGYDGQLLSGIMVVVGHNWPIVFKFKGGKGIATTIAVVMMINYLVAIISVAVGIIFIIKTKYVSLGSVIGMSVLPIATLIVVRPFNTKMIVFTIILSFMALLRHRGNIVRLLNGQESKLGEKA